MIWFGFALVLVRFTKVAQRVYKTIKKIDNKGTSMGLWTISALGLCGIHTESMRDLLASRGHRTATSKHAFVVSKLANSPGGFFFTHAGCDEWYSGSLMVAHDNALVVHGTGWVPDVACWGRDPGHERGREAAPAGVRRHVPKRKSRCASTGPPRTQAFLAWVRTMI